GQRFDLPLADPGPGHLVDLVAGGVERAAYRLLGRGAAQPVRVHLDRQVQPGVGRVQGRRALCPGGDAGDVDPPSPGGQPPSRVPNDRAWPGAAVRRLTPSAPVTCGNLASPAALRSSRSCISCRVTSRWRSASRSSNWAWVNPAARSEPSSLITSSNIARAM